MLCPEDIPSKVCQTVNVNGVKHCYLIVSLIQKFDRSVRKRNINAKEEYINFRLYKVCNVCKERILIKLIPSLADH